MAKDLKKTQITTDNCILLICDIQEKFKGTFRFDKLVENALKLINVIKILNVPIIIAEHQPTSYGPTIKIIDKSGMSDHVKNQYSMCTEEIMDEISEHANKCPDLFHVILIGVETHVCVENTAIDLRKKNFEVHIVADCCISRLLDDKLLALQRMRDMGCQVATTENIVSKLKNKPMSQEVKDKLRDALAEPKRKGIMYPVTHI